MMASFVFRSLNIIVLAAVIAFIVLDVRTHGSFKDSKTGVFLKRSGALQFGELALTKFRSYSQQVYWWSRKNIPVYLTKTRETALPFLLSAKQVLTTLAQQLWTNVKIVVNYFLEKKPLVEQWVNKYLPGLVDTISSWFTHVVKLLLKYLTVAVQWLKENVFVGSLSPESLQRYTMEAFNTTRTVAIQTFSWLNNKVVTVVSTP